MLWIDIIKNIAFNLSCGLIFSAILLVIFYISYRTVVVGAASPFSHAIIGAANTVHTRSYEHRVDSKMGHYRELTEKTDIISTVVPLILVVIVAYLFYNQLLFFAVVGTGSMEPTLMTGDLVLIQNVDAEPQIGDIIMFDTDSVPIPVIHRVHSVSEQGFKTKGDAVAGSRTDDWVVSDDQVCGEAVEIGGEPIVIRSFGRYFIEDVQDGETYTKYGREYGFVKKFVQSVKSLGLVIFIVCILMYILSAKR
ncbi:MAG: signal peptidase I [Euryarchaeota archaeon]|nr:signal peptidase I [Euryarchaeota archaeon]